MSRWYKFNKETIAFIGDFEKAIHKTVSAIHFGETVSFSCSPKNKNEQDNIVRVIKKSACYNSIDVKVRWNPDHKSISIIHQL